MSRFIYHLLLYVVLPFVPLKLWWRGIKQPAYRQYWAERFGFYRFKSVKSVIWLHCVSVGETRAAEPLIHALMLQYPNHQILLSHTTPTGREASEQLFADRVMRVYLPYDLPFAVSRFLTHFQPKIGLLMETELWFNLIASCKKRDIPLLLLNARLSERSARGYKKLGLLVSNGLQSLSAIAAQTADDAARLKSLSAQNVHILGNLKFDVKPPGGAYEKGLQLRQLFNADDNRLVFVAASTREGEEALILKVVKDLKILLALKMLTVIVPRHPQRFDEVETLIKQTGLNCQRRSQLSAPIDANVDVILGDSMGELFSYYVACDFTFVGGSLLEFGGQNLIEAATMGKPILIGQHTYNFAEASQKAIAAGAAIQVKNVEELRINIQNLSNSPQQRQKMQQASLEFSQASAGATLKTLQLIATYLKT